jgi:hypothetical protein
MFDLLEQTLGDELGGQVVLGTQQISSPRQIIRMIILKRDHPPWLLGRVAGHLCELVIPLTRRPQWWLL